MISIIMVLNFCFKFFKSMFFALATPMPDIIGVVKEKLQQKVVNFTAKFNALFMLPTLLRM